MKDINKISVNLRYSFNNDPPELKEIYAKNLLNEFKVNYTSLNYLDFLYFFTIWD